METTIFSEYSPFVIPGGFNADIPLEVTPISSLEKVHKTYRVGHCGVSLSHNSCLYLFGGWNDQRYINYGLLFNVESLKLVVEQTKDRVLPPPRRDHTLCRIDTKSGPLLFLFGGWSHEYDGNELWVLASDWKWKQLDVKGTAPCPRRGHSANVIGTEMFIVGGLYGFTKYLNDLHIYECDGTVGGTWKQPELIGSTRPPPRAWHSSNVVGHSQILFFGGTAGRNSFFEDCWCYDKMGHFWFDIELQGVHRPIARCSHSMVKIFEDEQFVKERHDPIDRDSEDKDTQRDGDEPKRDRLQFIMFGGLVPNLMDRNEKKDEENAIEKKLKQLSKVTDGIKINGKRVEKDSDDWSSDSDVEDNIKNANRIELSNDLYVLSLEV